jgi:CRP-like cAMP-binding protein
VNGQNPSLSRSNGRLRDTVVALREESPAKADTGQLALLDAEPDFAAGLSARELHAARGAVLLPVLSIARGGWQVPPPDEWPPPVSAVLVLEGLIARHVSLCARVCTQLIGPGDVFDPWTVPSELLPTERRFEALENVTATVLDGRFAAAALRWPQLGGCLQRRLCERADRLAGQTAISQLPTVAQRILAIFWQLAEQHGRVRRDGVLLRVRLTHQLIGQLIGAQRPSVTLALGELLEQGWLERCDERAWLLAWGSQDVLGSARSRPRPRLVALPGGLDGATA